VFLRLLLASNSSVNFFRGSSNYVPTGRTPRRWTHLPGSKAPSALPYIRRSSGRRTFVCVVETSPPSGKIKIFEPIDQNVRWRNKLTFRKVLQGGNDKLRIYKELYVPEQSSSIHFLRTELRVACVNGFEIIDPDTLDTRGLLDLSDESCDFVRRRSDHTYPKPVAIYCIENKFLLCYDGACFAKVQRG
jgi:hypothetical protein